MRNREPLIGSSSSLKTASRTTSIFQRKLFEAIFHHVTYTTATINFPAVFWRHACKYIQSFYHCLVIFAVRPQLFVRVVTTHSILKPTAFYEKGNGNRTTKPKFQFVKRINSMCKCAALVPPNRRQAAF